MYYNDDVKCHRECALLPVLALLNYLNYITVHGIQQSFRLSFLNLSPQVTPYLSSSSLLHPNSREAEALGARGCQPTTRRDHLLNPRSMHLRLYLACLKRNGCPLGFFCFDARVFLFLELRSTCIHTDTDTHNEIL